MNKNRFLTAALVAVSLLGTVSCSDQLDVKNPNAPTTDNLDSEPAIYALATGGVYLNGFFNGDDWLGNSYFSLPMGYNELMADNVGASASNNQVTTVGQPDYIAEANGSGEKTSNPSPSVGIIRTYNNRASTGANNNAIHYQWLNMYALNNAMNLLLTVVEDVPYTGDKATKVHALKAWAYFWKGYAYSSIGTKYYSGLIVNEFGVTNGDYVSHDVIIDESNKYFDLAATELDGATNALSYEYTMGKIIATQNQVGRGGIPSTAEWKHNINSLKARNLILNKLAPFVNGSLSSSITGSSFNSTMSPADWQTVLDLTANGIQQGETIFIGRTTGANDFFSANGGTVAALTANSPASTATFKVSERVMQNYDTADYRLLKNFLMRTDDTPANGYSNDYIYTTRYTLIDGGTTDSIFVWKKLADEDDVIVDSLAYLDETKLTRPIWVYADLLPGNDAKFHESAEVVIGSSWEETALIRAEALIRTGDVAGGLALVDQVRDYMGAGLAHVSGVITDQELALSELVKEKRVALLFRGLYFYDLRRWGWTYDISKGGGAYDQRNIVDVKTANGAAGEKPTWLFNYNFMDYWDVPANESVLNPPTSGVVTNPNF